MKKRANILSVKLLFSYLSILAVPLAAICIVYYTASKMMYMVQEQKMLSTLRSTATETQQSLTEITNLGLYISSAREFAQMRQLLQKENRRATFYEMYELSLVFPNYSNFNSAVRDVYFFFSNQDYVLRLPAVVPATERSYQSIGQLLADDYDSLQAMLSAEPREMQVLTLDSKEPGRKLLGIAQSFPLGVDDVPLGTVLLLLDDRHLRAGLANNLYDDSGIVLMLDSSGRVLHEIVGTKTANLPGTFSYAALPHEAASELRIQGVVYSVCYAQTPNGQYSFYSLLPKNVLIEKIGAIRPLIILLCIASAGISLAICLLLWNRRRMLVLRYYRYETEFGQVGAPCTNFWDIVRGVLDSMSELQRTVKRNIDFSHSAVIQKLLYGKYTSEEKLRQDLSDAQIVLAGSGYCVAAIRFKRNMQALPRQSLTEFHLLMRAGVAENVSLPHYCCEPEDMMLALVVPTRTEASLRTLKQELHALEDYLIAEAHVEAFIGIGPCVSSLMDLADSYAQAGTVCDYLQYHDMRLVMEAAHLPHSTEAFFFPMETELSLIRIIEQGNGTALRDLFHAITYENFTLRTLSPEMTSRLIELVRCTAIRALRSTVPPETLSAMGKAETLPAVLSLLEAVQPGVKSAYEQQMQQHLESRKQRLQQLIAENYQRDDYTISCLAQQMQMSETKLYKDFRSMFGISFSDYLESIRIYNACALLKTGCSVKEVSTHAGYSSDYSFRRAFKRVMGLTPSSYLESLHK